jgi:hypothetical protein
MKKANTFRLLQDELFGLEFMATNAKNLTHHIYPCPGCGAINYRLSENDITILHIELDSYKKLKAATDVWNCFSGMHPMNPKEFVQFLDNLFYESLPESEDFSEQNLPQVG